MTFLPIVERELRVAARLTATYRNRVLIVGIFAFISMLIFVFGAFASNPGTVGSRMFWILSYLVLAFCLLEGVRKTADCLSEEKREGTLGLLFLTDLKSYDIIFGKLAGASLNSIYGLFSILPMLALPLLLGGLTPGEFWRVALALANILFFSLCAGMCVSSLVRMERHAMGGTLAVIAVVSAAPAAARAVHFLSPLYAFHAAAAKVYPHAAADYWHSIWITQAVSWAMLAWAAWALPYSWHEEKFHVPGVPAGLRMDEAQRLHRGDCREAGRRVTMRTDMLRINPAYWLAGRNSGQRVLLSLLTAAAIISAALFTFHADLNALPFFIAVIWVINFTLKLRIAVESCHCLAEARRNGALEMLLVTPLTVPQIINGQWLALRREFFVPVSLILGSEILGLFGGLFTATYGKQEDGFELVLSGAGVLAYLGLVVLDIFAVIWAGMWYGLSAKKEGQAVFKTILFVLLLPPLSLILFCYGLPFLIGIPVFWISWGSQNLRREFRRLAAERFSPASPGSTLWSTVETNPKPLPPVI